ncbi:ATP-binding protein [Bifidobacterium vespertilionis]|uniref:ATP-binding protein n=1 Tax=Bifidobacterium vespertilionis TaxID=2562524 RepID=A0A5J5DX00_9BIFI|nr:ATP-binding protein [Bifidobacterium vespertilionis]KAA8821406.1 ATP-binding protein [Bifidobacterium vespertilionis]KAA8824351.1 ATP-binding protein [Bifidobacterium vespertilionis]
MTRIIDRHPAPDYASLVREMREYRFPRPIRRKPVIRDLPKPAMFNLVHILTGMRRSGKTFHLFQLINDLLDAGIPRDAILYFNFADERLQPMPEDVLEQTVNEFWRQCPQSRSGGTYLFLDEVQEAAHWQGFCQRLAEHEPVTIVITGSSSKLSSEEIATNFRGRSYAHEVLPLSFREYCDFHDLKAPAPDDDAFSPQTTTAMEAAFDRYLIEGGFPGVQRLSEAGRIDMLQSYMRDVVARDVADRLGRSDITLANQITLYALRNTSCELSVSNMAAQLEQAGYKLYWNKARRILDLLEQAFLCYEVREYATTLKPGSTTPPKVYSEDPGFTYAVSRANQQDVGKRLKTAVYLELRRRQARRRTDSITSLTLPTDRHEKIDFLVGDALGMEPYAAIQVTAEMTRASTRDREIAGLELTMRRMPEVTSTIITLRQEGTISTDSGTIRVIPAWQWALRDGR